MSKAKILTQESFETAKRSDNVWKAQSKITTVFGFKGQRLAEPRLEMVVEIGGFRAAKHVWFLDQQ